MHERGGWQDKLATSELQRLAGSDSDTPVSVLIELDLPQQQVHVRAVTRGDTVVLVPSAAGMETEDTGSDTERKVADARDFLENVLGTSPRWLRSAGSFVARVTPAQLRTIADYPLTKAIWPNRELHAPISSNIGPARLVRPS